jgi:MFS family permease
LLEAGSLGVQQNYIPLVYAVLNLATIILGFPAGILVDRVGKLPVMGLTYAVFLLTSIAGIFLTPNPLFGFLIAFMFGSYLSISDTVQRELIPDFSNPQLKGTAYAVYYALIGFCAFVANSIFGALWTTSGPGPAFEFTLVTSLAGFVAIIFFMKRSAKLQQFKRGYNS